VRTAHVGQNQFDCHVLSILCRREYYSAILDTRPSPSRGNRARKDLTHEGLDKNLLHRSFQGTRAHASIKSGAKDQLSNGIIDAYNQVLGVPKTLYPVGQELIENTGEFRGSQG
jgi:hypothetical protein